MRKTYVWQIVGLIGLFVGSIMLVNLAIADEDHDSSYKKRHHSGMMGKHAGKGHGMGRSHTSLSPLAMKEELGLNDDQVKALQPIETDYRKSLIKNGANLRVAMIDLGSLLDQQSPDRGAISAKVDEISAVQKSLMMYRVDTLLKLKDILTTEQYDQFRSRLKAQMESGIGRRMHGMGGMMGHGMMGAHGYGKGRMGSYEHDDDKDDDD